MNKTFTKNKSPADQDMMPSIYSPPNFKIIKPLDHSKNSVFLIYYKSSYHVMKVFSPECKVFFQNEVRFKNITSSSSILPIQQEGCMTSSSKKIFSKLEYYYTVSPFCPNGTLFDYVSSENSPCKFNEKLVRNLFKSLLSGVELLHSQGIAHLDLKPENILIDNSYNLRIIDFETSWMEGDDEIMSKGSCDYRGPEFFSGDRNNINPYKADIYSLGILLFVMMTGCLPFFEEGLTCLRKVFDKKPKAFWKAYRRKIDVGDNDWSQEFRNLFCMMVRHDVNERCTIEDVKNSQWFNEETYSEEEYVELMNNFYLHT